MTSRSDSRVRDSEALDALLRNALSGVTPSPGFAARFEERLAALIEEEARVTAPTMRTEARSSLRAERRTGYEEDEEPAEAAPEVDLPIAVGAAAS